MKCCAGGKGLRLGSPNDSPGEGGGVTRSQKCDLLVAGKKNVFQSELNVSQFLLPVWAPLLMLDNLVNRPLAKLRKLYHERGVIHLSHKMKKLDLSKEIVQITNENS